MKKSFTLIEMLIVITILGIFSLVLFSAYNKISEISFRVEQQKKVNEEFLFISEVLQNFANRNSIDFGKYGNNLTSSSGFTDILYLSGEDGTFSIYTSGNCTTILAEPTHNELNEGCSFFFQKSGENAIKLTNDSIYFSRAIFKIIPYGNNYFSQQGDAICGPETNYFACVNDDGFWLIVKIYPKNYNNQIRANNIHIFIQDFFNI